MSEKAKEKKPTLEEAFSEIEGIIEQMENPEVSLDESFRLYQRGIEQLKCCNTLLDKVEKKMQVLHTENEYGYQSGN